MKIKVNYTPSVHKVEVDRSKEIYESERNAANDPHEMDGYREKDI